MYEIVKVEIFCCVKMEMDKATNAFLTSFPSFTCLKKFEAFSTIRGGTVLTGLYSFLGTFFSTYVRCKKSC